MSHDRPWHMYRPWLMLLAYLYAEKNQLIALHQRIRDKVSLTASEHEILAHLSIGASSPFDRAESWNMQGMLAFGEGEYKSSLACFRKALACNPLHANSFPALTWNCVVLGLTKDASAADASYRELISQGAAAKSAFYAISDPDVRWSELLHALATLQNHFSIAHNAVSHLDRDDVKRWPTLGYDFVILDLVRSYFVSTPILSRSDFGSFWRQWPEEWVPAMLVALLAYSDNDLAQCAEMLDMTRANMHSTHHLFWEDMQRLLLLGLPTLSAEK